MSNDEYTHINYWKMNKKKILGFMPIHYSGDYLKESLLSVEPFVTKMVVAYSEKPSQGHGNETECPDKEEDIFRICQEILGDKLIWDRAESYSLEMYHRDVRYKYAAGFDFILNVDSDEIMLGVEDAIEYASNYPVQYFGIEGYVNFFRSFSWVCYDGYRPIRIENLRFKNGVQNLNCKMTILHFSCAQREEVMRYKYKNFGHAAEIKENYLDGIFYAWSPTNNIPDIHPVAISLWNAVPYDKTQMPEYLKQHPNYNKELIK